MIVLVTGVAGAGKSTVGAELAKRLGWLFIEGDALHSEDNIARMARGEPLTEADRAPWLALLRCRIEEHLERGVPAVIATSALRKSYRETLKAGDARILLVFLDADPEVARSRLQQRRGHFFRPELLDSQYETLEWPYDALKLPADLPVATLVDRIIEHIAAYHPDRDS
jgi:carbohydrate kinase (thermoresistant glucokinase family)